MFLSVNDILKIWSGLDKILKENLKYDKVEIRFVIKGRNGYYSVTLDGRVVGKPMSISYSPSYDIKTYRENGKIVSSIIYEIPLDSLYNKEICKHLPRTIYNICITRLFGKEYCKEIKEYSKKTILGDFCQ